MDVCLRELDYSQKKIHRICLMGDQHLESRDANVRRCTAHLDKCQELGIPVFFGGDLADLILPGDIKRFSSGKHGELVNAIIDQTVDKISSILMPYADIIEYMSPGNHEQSALKYHYTDLTKRIREKLQARRNPQLPPIHQGGYRGFIVIRFLHGTHRAVKNFVIFRHHGRGGGAPVTKGMIDLQRLRATFSADLYWLAHKHTSIDDDSMQEVSVNRAGKISVRRQAATLTGTYMEAPINVNYSQGDVVDYNDRFYNMLTQSVAMVTLRPKTQRPYVAFNVTKNFFFDR